MQTTFRRYLAGKVLWTLLTLAIAVVLNWYLPRLIPGNPVDVLVAQAGAGGMSGEQQRIIRAAYVHQFGLDHPIWQQFVIYVGNLFHGNFGQSFSLYPAAVGPVIREALPWTIALQLPAILIGWIVGNLLGAVAAYRSGWLDRTAYPTSLLVSSVPYYCVAILLLYMGAVVTNFFPVSGGYSFGTVPDLSFDFIGDALQHYWLPFLSLVVVFIGGQAIGMRSMAIYELNSDYVNYARSLGVGDGRIVRYIFRNGALPQVTGLAISIGTLVGGALITEIVFSYPGVGSLLFTAIRNLDYPLISGITLIITVTVLLANFMVDVVSGLIDPRIRAAQSGDR
jgi:peptide/nickel transport system permease protein